MDNNNPDSAKNDPLQTVSPTVSPSVSTTPVPGSIESPLVTPSPVPEETAKPDQNLVIRTDYENFLPNESGEIPIIMFHRFIEAYEENTEKEFTTTFAEFEALLQTLYDAGYRLISMEDFIDCNIKVPAGTMPMVFTFDDGTPGQFNLIEEGGCLKVNPKSAVGIMMAFNEKHPDFGLKGIFYVNMDIGDNTFKGAGTLRERFEILQSLGFELGNHTWGHVDYTDPKNNSAGRIQESIGRNQEKADEILPGLRFYSLALPYGSLPDKSLYQYLESGSYNGIEYKNETIMAVGAEPSVPSISKKYNSLYVRRIRAQGRVPVNGDLTWWLPRMSPNRMFISDGDPTTIVVPEEKRDTIAVEKLNGKRLITY
ncbi:MAG: polysaccharide deacetylase family protein [Clostridiaceae bacterium]|nr:polysaccharide deacetylase family protein [Clostridiaceae bacterium]